MGSDSEWLLNGWAWIIGKVGIRNREERRTGKDKGRVGRRGGHCKGGSSMACRSISTNSRELLIEWRSDPPLTGSACSFAVVMRPARPKFLLFWHYIEPQLDFCRSHWSPPVFSPKLGHLSVWSVALRRHLVLSAASCVRWWSYCGDIPGRWFPFWGLSFNFRVLHTLHCWHLVSFSSDGCPLAWRWDAWSMPQYDLESHHWYGSYPSFLQVGTVIPPQVLSLSHRSISPKSIF